MISSAKQRRRPWFRRNRDAVLRQRIIERASCLRTLGSEQLLEDATDARAWACREGGDSDELICRAFALVYEALRRVLDIELFDVQLTAALAMARGNVVEMQTGEGKTLACAPTAFLHALKGRGVHVVTPNSYLAKRDFELLLPVWRMLGVQAGLLPEQSPPNEKHDAYLCDITYGTAYEFGFDHLRDQLALRRSGAALGQALLGRLLGDPQSQDGIQRGLEFAIIDEIDNVLLDDAGSPLILSDATGGSEADDAEAHRAARALAPTLRADEHYLCDPSSELIRLTEQGEQRIHLPDVAVAVQQLRRTWTEYVEHALRAELFMRRDVHYVVDDGEILIVDASTGRIFSDRTWRDGLHQAVEAREGLAITQEKTALAQITRQRYFRRYAGLCGMTGTATGCEREFRHVYGLSVVPIPLRTASRREQWPLRFFVETDAKWAAIADSVRDRVSHGRPVLVGTRSIWDSERLASTLTTRGIPFRLLNGRQDAEEAAIIARAGESAAVTIATNLAGRGTDIRLAPGVAERGGLHVIVSECHESPRVDRQLIGRCARQGDPGSAQVFAASSDSLIQKFGPWLARSVGKYATADGEVALDLTSRMARIQRLAERLQYTARCALLRQDLARDSLLLRRSSDF